MFTRFCCNTCMHSMVICTILMKTIVVESVEHTCMYIEREQERDVYQILHFFNKTFGGTAIRIVGVCVFACSLSFPLFWEGDGGQMTSQGSYLNRRLRSTNLLLVALLLPVLPQSVLCLGSEVTRLKTKASRLLRCWPLHLALVSTRRSTGFEQWHSGRTLALDRDSIFDIYFISFFFFFSKICDLWFSIRN